MGHQGLTLKQAAFAREYVIDFSAKDAAQRAGYSDRTATQIGYQQLQNPFVKAEVARLTKEKADRASIQADEIVEALAHIVRANICDVMEWGMVPVVDQQGEPVTAPNGMRLEAPRVRVFDSSTLAPEVRSAVAAVGMSDKGTLTVKMHDKLAAIEKLMRHLGMLEPAGKQQVDGLVALIASVQGTTIPIATHDDVQRFDGRDV